MTALSKATSKAVGYDSLNSLLAETGWRMEWVTDEEGQQQLVYFPLTETDFLHPEEDYHLPSNTFHGTVQRDLIDVLQRRYAKREDVGVFGDLIIKWGIKGLRQHCPDVCVVFGLRDKEKYRSKFIVPEEGTKPAIVMEVVSPHYRTADRQKKVKQYARAGIPEYIIFDRRRQRGELLDEVLGYRLEGESYVPIEPDAEGKILSQVLAIWLGMREGKVMLFEGSTGEPLLTSQALEQLAEQEHQRAEAERQRAEAEHQRAEAEHQRAEAERLEKLRLIEQLRQLGVDIAE
jgi:Uma2 family endonuclease